MPKYYDGPPRVLVGYDGSADSHAALRLACLEVVSREAELLLVTSIDDIVFGSAWNVVLDANELKHNAARQLNEAVQLAQAEGVPLPEIFTDVVMGNPAQQLTRLSERVSLVVIGRRSVSGGRPYTGSTAVQLAGTCRCPLLITSASHKLPEQGIEKLTVGVDSSRNRGRVALAWGYDIADRYEGELRVLNVVRSASPGRWFSSSKLSEAELTAAVDSAQSKVAAMVESYADANPDVDTTVEVVSGEPLKLLTAASKESDLLLVEVQSSFPSYAVGGIARGIITHSACPVGVIRSKEAYAG
ncbi:MAG: universal stress protein [Propionibacteriaceae bacterium]|jgi:nucleotide-binding universal stress UspA family protein|nr:universal stress protein [Propionibacteriaceae bacterium]